MDLMAASSCPSIAIAMPLVAYRGLRGPGAASGGEIFESTLILFKGEMLMTMACKLFAWLFPLASWSLSVARCVCIGGSVSEGSGCGCGCGLGGGAIAKPPLPNFPLCG